MLTYSLEHLRVPIDVTWRRKVRIQGRKKKNCYRTFPSKSGIEKLKIGLKQERSFRMKSFFRGLAVCFQSLNLAALAFHFVSKSTISMDWIF